MTPDQFKARQAHIGLSNKELGDGLGYTERQIQRFRNGDTAIRESLAMAMEKLTPDYKEE